MPRISIRMSILRDRSLAFINTFFCFKNSTPLTIETSYGVQFVKLHDMETVMNYRDECAFVSSKPIYIIFGLSALWSQYS